MSMLVIRNRVLFVSGFMANFCNGACKVYDGASRRILAQVEIVRARLPRSHHSHTGAISD
jgi:hypothetical protein